MSVPAGAATESANESGPKTPAIAAPEQPAKPAPAAESEAPKPVAKRRPAAQPVAEPAPRSLFSMFRSNWMAPQQQPSAPARSASASASQQGDGRAVMAAKAASSYSTSRNALGFGLYRVIPKETVEFRERHAPGTIIVRQSEKRLYFVLGDGKAIRYAITVGREGAAWAGVSSVSDKREWPAWTPTPGILARQPDLPRHVEGGPGNPLGARALYLGQTMYRIHGTNEPWRIGEEASSGCIRLSNDDVIDLYNRVKLGATVIVQR